MKQIEKRNIIIGILCCMIVLMSIGYAALSQNLKIIGTAHVTGSWKIYIESIKLNESASSIKEEDSTTQISEEGLLATYTADFQKPTDVAVYDVVVANAGTIDAVLKSLELELESNEFFTFETIGIKEGDGLEAQTGDTPTRINFQIKVTFKDSVTEANMPPVGTYVKGSVILNYVQATGGNSPITPEGSEEDLVYLLSTGDISAARDNSIIYKYYSDGSLEIQGSGKVVDFSTLSVVLDYTLFAYITNNIIYDKATDAGKKILDGTSIVNDESTDTMLNTFALMISGYYNKKDIVDGINSSFEEPLKSDFLSLIDLAYENVPILSKVTIKEGITNISSGMFLGVPASIEIKLPSTVKTLDYWAMPFCSNIVLNEGLVSMEEEALIGYGSTSITLPSTLTTINSSFGESNLEKVIVLGDSTRFDSNWANLFGDAIKVAG